MIIRKHLYVAVSGHGYGHIGQVAPIVNHLFNQNRHLHITLRCSVSRSLLESLIAAPFIHDQSPVDFGMLMRNPLDTLLEESHQRYVALHTDLNSAVEQEKAKLSVAKPDLLLANIPYVILLAAKQLGISSIAISSLNWAEIYAGYCGHLTGAPSIIQQMKRCYTAASVFLAVTPAMAMPDLNNLQSIGPVTRIGKNHRSTFNQALSLQPSDRLVMVSLGGIPGQPVIKQLPEIAGIHWLVTGMAWPDRKDITLLEQTQIGYIDALCSCDAMIAKPGYGCVAEVVCNQIPVLYAKRGDWPEEPFLVSWLETHGTALEISRQQLEQGNIEEALRQLWLKATKTKVEATGIKQATDIILKTLGSA